MAEKKHSGGKRVAKTYERKRQAYGTYSRAQAKSVGRREEKVSSVKERQQRRQLRRLTVSAIILMCVIGVKLLSPQTLEPIRSKLLQMMGTDTDFVEVFSNVGRAVGSGEELKEIINDTAVAVFGSEEISAESSATELPEDVCMTQQGLGFAYAAPVDPVVNDPFGYRTHPSEETEKFHYGIDLQGNSGDVISAFADGTVTAVGESSALGKYITILHKNGYTTLYAHCSRITASSGQLVRMGDPIAEVGKTGDATGPHLHFELQRDTLYLNPIYYLCG